MTFQGEMHMSIRLALQDRLRREFNRSLAQTLLRLLHSDPLNKLLDVGGGTGFLAELLNDSYEETYVLEPDIEKLKFGTKKRRNVKFVSRTLGAYPIP